VDNYFELSFGRIHICEVSLRGRRETSENGENSGETPSQDEERIREQRENAGQIHLWEVSLRGRRETSGKKRKREGRIHIYEVSLRRRRETSETKRKFGDYAKRDFGKNIFMEVYL